MMPKHSPPRRESIEDHLATAKRCLERLGVVWRPRLASRPFVLKLIRNGLLEVLPQPRADGMGVGQRMSPSSYHALLKIVSWKAGGVFSWRAWRISLWVSGTYVPVSEAREALLYLLRRAKRVAELDFAPNRNWNESMHAKWDRRVNQLREGLLAPEFARLLEPLGIAFIRPDRIQEANPDIGAGVRELYDSLGQHLPIPKQDLEHFLTILNDRTKNGENLTIEEQEEGSRVYLAMVAPLVGEDNAPEFLKQLTESFGAVAFKADGDTLKYDFSIASLISEVENSTDKALLRARAVVFDFASGRVNKALACLPPELSASPLVAALRHSSTFYREMPRHSPLFTSIIIASTLQGFRAPDPPKAKEPNSDL